MKISRWRRDRSGTLMVGLPVMAALIFAAVPVHDVIPEPLAQARPARTAVAPPPPPERPQRVIVRRSVDPRSARPSGRRPTSGVPAGHQVDRSVRAAVPAASIALPPAPPPAVAAPPRTRLVGVPLVVVRTPSPARAPTVMAVALSAEAGMQAP